MKNILLTILSWLVVNGNAQTNQLVTTTLQGGTYNNGAIFIADSNGNNFHEVYSFQSATGSGPVGRLAIDENGTVYGVTKYGGSGDSSVIYSYNLQSDSFTLLHDCSMTPDSGWWDRSGPVLLPDGKLYGVTQNGGAYGGGAIYRLDPASFYYEDLFDLDANSGQTSTSGLIYLSNGKLYGMTLSDGLHGRGTIFSFDPVANSFAVLHHFIDSSGFNPGYGSLMQAADGKLYGTTQLGGGNFGALFSYNLGSNTYTCLHKFSSSSLGMYPNNALVQAPDGKLYGIANSGGMGGASDGVLFSYDIQSNTYTVLHDFYGSQGAKPESSLTLASNGKLFGTTSRGGAHQAGLVFSYDIDSNLYSIVYEFDSVTGTHPAGMVLETKPRITCVPMGSSLLENTCAGHPYYFYGSPLVASGTYTHTLSTSQGCDSIITLHLQVLDSSVHNFAANICQGEVYLFNQQQYSVSGSYSATYLNVSGCDSVVTLALSVEQPSSSTLQATIVSGNTYNFNGTLLTDPGTYTDTLINSAGCDSVITLTLDLTTGNANAAKDYEIQLQPNPAHSLVQVKMSEDLIGSELIITDALGKEVKRQRILRHLMVVNTEMLSSGIYFVKVGDTVKRLMIQ